MSNEYKLSDEFLNGPWEKHFDLAYCENSPSQMLDIWLPTSEHVKPYPVIMYFHGGAFFYGNKRETQSEPMFRSLQRGYAVVDVQYRLAGEALFPAMVLDAKTAVRFVRAHADEYGLDASRILAWGSSAGGWIVGMLGTTDGNPAFEDLSMGYEEYSSAVQAVVDWCGPCGSFTEMYHSPLADPDSANWVESLFIGTDARKAPELCRVASPSTYAHKNIPPFLILHGELDDTVPLIQSEIFSSALKTATGGQRVEYHVLSGTGHHSKLWNDDKTIERITSDFVDRMLKG